MDESWRMSIGDGFAHNSSARRRSIEKDRIRMSPADVVPADEDDEDEDFLDVFGGPPRILRHRRSAAGFYKEVFSPPLAAAAEAAGTGRRNLPGFCIPPATNNNTSTSTSTSSRSLVRTEDGFYDDIFGSSHCIINTAAAAAAAAAVVPARDRRSTTKSGSGNNCQSWSNSSSDRDSSTSYLINSHPRANPRSSTIVHHRHRDDATLSSFASKLRPITIPTRQHDSTSQPSTLSGGGEEGSSSRTVPISNIHFSCLEDLAENKAAGTTTADFFPRYLHRPDADFSYSVSPSAETRRRSYYCPNCRRKPSDQMANNNMYHFSGGGSPSSVASSAVLEPMTPTAPTKLRELEKKVVVEVKREIARSFVGHRPVRETEGAAALDEAIAWARGKFWSHQASDITSDEILDFSEEAKGISKEEPSLN
ncbi:uncharacterized protein M6B38_120620 [Iris pallida]|uniref:Uncharacterized protein n=1 Tax=Iris pallida TaxID=29817 RepID=A0AAX6HAI1_IRIPA|nr:uncharacterized protein M6B38_120620 [Iris pallida]